MVTTMFERWISGKCGNPKRGRMQQLEVPAKAQVTCPRCNATVTLVGITKRQPEGDMVVIHIGGEPTVCGTVLAQKPIDRHWGDFITIESLRGDPTPTN